MWKMKKKTNETLGHRLDSTRRPCRFCGGRKKKQLGNLQNPGLHNGVTLAARDDGGVGEIEGSKKTARRTQTHGFRNEVTPPEVGCKGFGLRGDILTRGAVATLEWDSRPQDFENFPRTLSNAPFTERKNLAAGDNRKEWEGEGRQRRN